MNSSSMNHRQAGLTNKYVSLDTVCAEFTPEMQISSLCVTLGGLSSL